MLRKISLGLLIFSSLAFCSAGGFMVEYLVDYRTIRFSPVEKPVLLSKLVDFGFDCSVDEPAPYYIALRFDLSRYEDSLTFGQVDENYRLLFDSILFEIMVSAPNSSTESRKVIGLPYGYTGTTWIDDQGHDYYRRSSDTFSLDTGMGYSIGVKCGHIPTELIGQEAIFAVEMQEGWAKSIHVENYIRYHVRLYALIAAGIFLVASLLFWLWTRRRREPQRRR